MADPVFTSPARVFPFQPKRRAPTDPGGPFRSFPGLLVDRPCGHCGNGAPAHGSPLWKRGHYLGGPEHSRTCWGDFGCGTDTYGARDTTDWVIDLDAVIRKAGSSPPPAYGRHRHKAAPPGHRRPTLAPYTFTCGPARRAPEPPDLCGARRRRPRRGSWAAVDPGGRRAACHARCRVRGGRFRLGAIGRDVRSYAPGGEDPDHDSDPGSASSGDTTQSERPSVTVSRAETERRNHAGCRSETRRSAAKHSACGRSGGPGSRRHFADTCNAILRCRGPEPRRTSTPATHPIWCQLDLRG